MINEEVAYHVNEEILIMFGVYFPRCKELNVKKIKFLNFEDILFNLAKFKPYGKP